MFGEHLTHRRVLVLLRLLEGREVDLELLLKLRDPLLVILPLLFGELAPLGLLSALRLRCPSGIPKELPKDPKRDQKSRNPESDAIIIILVQK